MKYTLFADFDYIEEVKGYETSSQQKRPMLVDQRDYRYQINRLSDKTGKAFWRCSLARRIRCNATVVSLHNKIVRMAGEHTHPPLADVNKQTLQPFKDKFPLK